MKSARVRLRSMPHRTPAVTVPTVAPCFSGVEWAAKGAICCATVAAIPTTSKGREDDDAGYDRDRHQGERQHDERDDDQSLALNDVAQGREEKQAERKAQLSDRRRESRDLPGGSRSGSPWTTSPITAHAHWPRTNRPRPRACMSSSVPRTLAAAPGAGWFSAPVSRANMFARTGSCRTAGPWRQSATSWSTCSSTEVGVASLIGERPTSCRPAKNPAIRSTVGGGHPHAHAVPARDPALPGRARSSHWDPGFPCPLPLLKHRPEATSTRKQKENRRVVAHDLRFRRAVDNLRPATRFQDDGTRSGTD